MTIFRALTKLLIVGLIISAALHVILLMSDSPEYRTWVYIQIALHLISAGALWHVLRFSVPALIAFVGVSMAGVYINAHFLNYGNGVLLWVIPVVVYSIYGSAAFFAKDGFRARKVLHDA